MNNVNLTNKVALITGATSGIGKESALALAAMGAELFIVARNPEKGAITKEEIRKVTENSKVNLLTGDLSSLKDVQRIAQSFLTLEKPLHILLNNAGVFNLKREETIDGYEEMFAVNHLAPFLLTNLLLDRIKTSEKPRIVNVASGAHILVKEIKFEDLNFVKGFKPLKVYSHSKLANILFTTELAARLKETQVTVNAVDPGEVSTGLGQQNGVIGKLLYWSMKPFIQTPKKGAKTSIHVCTTPELEKTSGKYFRNGKEKNPKPWAIDKQMAERLWDVSERLVQIFITKHHLKG